MTNKSEISFIKKITDKNQKFINHKSAFIVFSSLILIFAILNFVFFGLGQININSPWVDNNEITNDYFAWLGWFELVIATFGSIFSVVGVILAIRFNKKFIYSLLVGETLIIIDAIVVGAIFTALSYLIMIIFALYNYFNWDKTKTESNMTKGKWIFIISFSIIYIIGGIIFSHYLIERGTGEMILDVVGSGIVILAWFIILSKNKWGFALFFLTDITYFVYFFYLGIWTSSSIYLIYMILDLTAFLSWW